MYKGPWIRDEPDRTLEVVVPDLMREIRRVLPRLTYDEQLLVASLVVDTCYHCHSAGERCVCWNDE
jgi:hypothetical protein